MLYLSLILVASGLFLVVTSLYSTQHARRSINWGDRFVPNDDSHYGAEERRFDVDRERVDHPGHNRREMPRKRADIDAGPPLEDFRGEDDTAVAEPSADRSGILDELDAHFHDNDIEEAVPEAASAAERPVSGRAVLYEDASGLVDYEAGESAIDPTLEAYSRLKRMGEGEVQIAAEGLILRAGKAVHRFDFYKIRDYKVGDNYIALYLRNSRSVRLFLVDENLEFRFEIQAAIEDYFRNAG
mgnify:CR=1 FL=1